MNNIKSLILTTGRL